MSHHATVIHREDKRSSPQSEEPAAGPPAPFEEMPGRSEWLAWHGARVHYRKEGAGAPLVLVHMIDVGASCIEWRRNTAFLCQGFTTYAVDLPGFGLSETPEEAPKAALYIRFLTDFMAEVRSRHGQAPAVVGSGGGAAYLASIAQSLPTTIAQMVLVAPTGVSACRPSPFSAIAYHALKLPLVSSLASADRTTILEHLQHDVYGEEDRASMTEAEARYYVSHRPGADAIERARVAGLLNVDLRQVIPKITQPTAVVWGRKATCPPVEDVEVWRDLNSQVRVRVFEKSGLCPHAEESSIFNQFVWDILGASLEAQTA